MSRTANEPSSGISEDGSMLRGFCGRTVTTAASPDFIQSGDAAKVTVRPQKPLSIEPSSEIPELGSFAVRDMGQTIAAGQVLEVDEA